jgi:hypothetical protein
VQSITPTPFFRDRATGRLVASGTGHGFHGGKELSQSIKMQIHGLFPIRFKNRKIFPKSIKNILQMYKDIILNGQSIELTTTVLQFSRGAYTPYASYIIVHIFRCLLNTGKRIEGI